MKNLSILIPTVLIKKAGNLAELIPHTPIGAIKPLNSTHGAIGGAALGGLGLGALSVLGQHFTEEGKRKSFRQKLMAALGTATLGAGAGALGGYTFTNAKRSEIVDNEINKNPKLLQVASHLKPNIRELARGPIDSYLQDANIREAIAVNRGENTPRLQQAKDEFAKSLIDDVIGNK